MALTLRQVLARSNADSTDEELELHRVAVHDAILRLDRSTLARELFGAEFVDGFLASKRMELQSFMDEITPWERRFLGSRACGRVIAIATLSLNQVHEATAKFVLVATVIRYADRMRGNHRKQLCMH